MNSVKDFARAMHIWGAPPQARPFEMWLARLLARHHPPPIHRPKGATTALREMVAAAPLCPTLHALKKPLRAASTSQAIAGACAVAFLGIAVGVTPFALIGVCVSASVYLAAEVYIGKVRVAVLQKPISRAKAQELADDRPLRQNAIDASELRGEVISALDMVLVDNSHFDYAGAQADTFPARDAAAAVTGCYGPTPEFECSAFMIDTLRECGTMECYLPAALHNQLTVALQSLRWPSDPLQVRKAIKFACSFEWMGDMQRILGPQTPADIELFSVAAILSWRGAVYAFNAGDTRVLLCHPRGVKRLTVDHGRSDPTETFKRRTNQTVDMQADGLTRAVDFSLEAKTRRQRVQVSSIPQEEARGGTFVIINQATSSVLSDDVINDFIVRAGEGAHAGRLARLLVCAAQTRQPALRETAPRRAAAIVVRAPETRSS